MRNSTTRFMITFLAIAFSCVSISQATPLKDYDGNRGKESNQRHPLADRVVAGGRYLCTVSVTEPPSGTGEPILFASLSFTDTLNLEGNARGSTGRVSGSKVELDEICQQLTDNLSNSAEILGCTPSPIRTEHTIGGNFVSDEWSMDVICNGNRNKVVNAVGVLVEEVMLGTELAQSSIQDNSTTRLDEVSWDEFQLMRGHTRGTARVSDD